MADEKISELPAIVEADLAIEDYIPVVDTDAGATKKISVNELDTRYRGIVVLQFTLDQNTRQSIDSVHGGIDPRSEGDVLNSGSPIAFTTGLSRLCFAIIAGSAIPGSFTVTGDTIDRNTGIITVGDSEVITTTTLTVDQTWVDAVGQTVRDFVGAYITTKWFIGAVVISTTDLNISDMDSFQIAYEQFNDSSEVEIIAADITFIVTNANAVFASHGYNVAVTGNRLVLASPPASGVVYEAGEMALGLWRIRRGGIGITFDGRTSGLFIDFFLGPANQTYFQSFSSKIWAKIRE